MKTRFVLFLNKAVKRWLAWLPGGALGFVFVFIVDPIGDRGPQCISPSDHLHLVGILAALVSLVLVIVLMHVEKRRVERKRVEEFKQRSAQAPTAKLEILSLSSLHLSDWQLLVAKLKLNKVPSDQVRYCQAQIERLQAELSRINSQERL